MINIFIGMGLIISGLSLLPLIKTDNQKITTKVKESEISYEKVEKKVENKVEEQKTDLAKGTCLNKNRYSSPCHHTNSDYHRARMTSNWNNDWRYRDKYNDLIKSGSTPENAMRQAEAYMKRHGFWD